MNNNTSVRAMRIAWLVSALISAAALAEPPVVTQPVTPGTLSYQGRIQTAAGVDYSNGVYGIEFRVYDAATAGNLLWGAKYVPYVQNGYFSVILGEINVGETALSGGTHTNVADLWKAVWIQPGGAGAGRYLGITVVESAGIPISGAAEAFPRQQLLAAPFAIQAQFARQAAGDFTISAGRKLTFDGDGSIEAGGSQIAVADSLNVTGDISATGRLNLGTGLVGAPGGQVYIGEAGVPHKLSVFGTIYSYDLQLVFGTISSFGDTLTVQDSLLVEGDLKAFALMPRVGDWLDVGRENENKNLTVWGNLNPKRISLRDGAIDSYSDTVTVNDGLDVKGSLKVNSTAPFMLKSFYLFDQASVVTNTAVSTNLYSAMIVGVDGGWGDMNEDYSGHLQDTMAFPSNGTWWVRCEDRVHENAAADWTIHVLYLRREMVDDQRTQWGTQDRS